MDCTGCGRALLPGAVICDGCGQRVNLQKVPSGLTAAQEQILTFHRWRLSGECGPSRDNLTAAPLHDPPARASPEPGRDGDDNEDDGA